jgi:hypothetical protein
VKLAGAILVSSAILIAIALGCLAIGSSFWNDSGTDGWANARAFGMLVVGTVIGAIGLGILGRNLIAMAFGTVIGFIIAVLGGVALVEPVAWFLGLGRGQGDLHGIAGAFSVLLAIIGTTMFLAGATVALSLRYAARSLGFR